MSWFFCSLPPVYDKNYDLKFDLVQKLLNIGQHFMLISSLKVLSNENRGGSKLVLIALFLLTVRPESVLFRAPMDTITRGAFTFSASFVHFDAIPTCWLVIFFSERLNLFVDFLLQRRSGLKNYKSLC